VGALRGDAARASRPESLAVRRRQHSDRDAALQRRICGVITPLQTAPLMFSIGYARAECRSPASLDGRTYEYAQAGCAEISSLDPLSLVPLIEKRN